MKNEKGIALTMPSKNNLNDPKTMLNHIPTQNKFQLDSAQSRRGLLDSTKLSRLPERKPIKPFTLLNPSLSDAKASGCLACGGRLNPDDAIQQSVKVCRRCLTQYAVIDSAIDDAAKRKRREMLERFAPEVSR